MPLHPNRIAFEWSLATLRFQRLLRRQPIPAANCLVSVIDTNQPPPKPVSTHEQMETLGTTPSKPIFVCST